MATANQGASEGRAAIMQTTVTTVDGVEITITTLTDEEFRALADEDSVQ